MVAAIGDTGYKIVLVLHVLCAIVGFGAVVLNGIYGAQIAGLMRSGRGAEGLAVYEANFKVSRIGEYFIYAVLLLGMGLIGMSDSAWGFDQTWIWLATALFVVALGLSHGLLLPRVKKMGALMRELAAGPPPAGGPPPQALALAKLAPQVGVLGLTLNGFLVAVLSLMVFKPA